MKKNIYTYVVDHGEDAPSVGVDTVVNGGQCLGVAFADMIEENSKMEDLIAEIRWADDMDEVVTILQEYDK